MIKLDYSKKIYVLGGISSIIIIGVIFFATYPLYNQITTLNNEVYDKRVQLAIYQQQRTNIEQTRQDYNKIKNDISNVSKIFISEDQILDLISALENTATTYSITQNISFDSSSQSDSDNVIVIQITARGDWLNLIQYLGGLEKLDYYLVIDDLNIINLNNNLTLTLSTKVFSQ